MKSNWLTFYELDGSNPFTIYFNDGFVTYQNLYSKIQTKNYILVGYNYIDVVVDLKSVCSWDGDTDFYYGRFQRISKEEFDMIFNPVIYDYSFEKLLS